MLLPFLQDKLNQSFPDPLAFTKEEEFTYAAKVTSVYKKTIQEILVEVQKWVQTAEFYEKKANGEMPDTFGIGREEKEGA